MFVGISTSATPCGGARRLAERLAQVDLDRRPVEHALGELGEGAADLAAIRFLERAEAVFGRRVLAGDADHRAAGEPGGAEAGDGVGQAAAGGDAADAGRRRWSAPSRRRRRRRTARGACG